MKTDRYDFYNELKSRNDIVSTGYALGYSGTKSGKYLQGDCPAHGSKSGTCLVIWPGIQGWKCYHCGKSGDVINLVELYKRCDHKTAVKYLADKAGIPYFGGKTLTPQEIAQREADMAEKVLVEDMLTESARWYNEQLKNHPDILDHLKDKNYGFSDFIIDQLKLGFSPVSSKSDGTSQLADHLNAIPEFKGKIHLTALFSFKSPSGPYYDYFKGRIVFPYWNGGKVVYMLARATGKTPADKYECYTKSDGTTIRTKENGDPDKIKFKKLRNHDPDDDKRKYISKFIQNDVFMGEDSVRKADEVIITEGAPDWVSAIDHGFAAVSPVTVRFRNEDLEKLERLTRNAKSIYIINDNEENKAGYDGAVDTAKYLTEKGKNVFLVELPRPSGKDKIDLNEYLKDHAAAELRVLMDSAKSFLQVLIDKLPADFIKAQPVIRKNIAPLLLDMEEGIQHYYVNLIYKKTKATTKAIQAEIDSAEKEKDENENKIDEPDVDPEVEKAALIIANDPFLFKKRIDVVNEAGIVGERKNVAMYFCTMDSRLLPDNRLNPNVLAVKNSGHFGAGKSITMKACTEFYPEDAYVMMTNGSDKSLYYLEGGLKHKCFIATEGFQFQENNATDSNLVYATRSLISEGRVSYFVSEKNEEDKYVTVEKKLEGPTSFITTTIMENLEAQLEDRMFTIHPDEGVEQTKGIISMTAMQATGEYKGPSATTQSIWKEFHKSLKPVTIKVPYALKLAEFITRNDMVPISTRRAFSRVLNVIKSVACSYQHQRKRDESGNLIAEISDYWMTLQVVCEAFRENMGQQDRKTEERLVIIEESGPITPKALAEKFGVAASAVSQWTKKKVMEGIVTWCDENGDFFVDDRELKKAKYTGKAYLKLVDNYNPSAITGLPTPYDLTGDPEWNAGGKLLKLYDLELEKRSDKVFRGVKEAFIPRLNTSDESEPVDCIPAYENERDGVKVLIENAEEKEIKKEVPKHKVCDLIRSTAKKSETIDERAISRLANEFGTIVGDGVARIGQVGKTPQLCRTGCKHYDGVDDVNDGEFKEYCCQREMTKIDEGKYCACFESKQPKLPEGVLPI